MSKPAASTTKAIEAADIWLAAVRATIDAQPASLNLDDLHGELQAAFDAAGRDTSHVLNTATELSHRYNYNASRHDTSLAHRSATATLTQLRERLDRALVDFDQQAELDAAYEELDRLEQNIAATQDQLQQAFVAGDVDAAMKLRGQAEVALPAQVNQTQLRIRDLLVARAEAALALPRQRIDAKAAAEEAAAAKAEAARQEWERLTAAHQVAAEDLHTSRAAIAAAERELATQRGSRERLANQQEADHQRRMRELFNLPERAAEPEPEPEPTSLRSLNYTTPRSYTQRAIEELQDDAEPAASMYDYTPRQVTR